MERSGYSAATQAGRNLLGKWMEVHRSRCFRIAAEGFGSRTSRARWDTWKINAWFQYPESGGELSIRSPKSQKDTYGWLINHKDSYGFVTRRLHSFTGSMGACSKVSLGLSWHGTTLRKSSSQILRSAGCGWGFARVGSLILRVAKFDSPTRSRTG